MQRMIWGLLRKTLQPIPANPEPMKEKTYSSETLTQHIFNLPPTKNENTTVTYVGTGSHHSSHDMLVDIGRT